MQASDRRASAPADAQPGGRAARRPSRRGATDAAAVTEQQTTSHATTPAHPARGLLLLPEAASLALGFAAVELAWSPRGIRALELLEAGALRAAREAATDSVPRELASVLEGYLAGDDVDPTELPVDLPGTPFLQRVWGALRDIPRGQVRSYLDVARAVGSPRATRAVGMANARNPAPLVVPCHRVVQANRALGGFSAGGPDRKRRLLRLEGVAVAGGRVHPRQLPLPA